APCNADSATGSPGAHSRQPAARRRSAAQPPHASPTHIAYESPKPDTEAHLQPAEAGEGANRPRTSVQARTHEAGGRCELRRDASDADGAPSDTGGLHNRLPLRRPMPRRIDLAVTRQ